MRKLYYILILLFVVHSSYAQKIHFTDTSNKWKQLEQWSVGNGTTGSRHFTLHFTKDTILNGKLCKMLVGSGNSYFREDTATQKVYRINLTDEDLYYDYSLKVGDTFRFKSVNLTFVHIVIGIDSMLINGAQHKIWDLAPVYDIATSFATEYFVIEGIGSDHGIFYPGYPNMSGHQDYLLCFARDGYSLTINNPFTGKYFVDGTSCNLSVTTTTKQNQSVTIIPNPANGSSKIILPYKMQSGKLIIVNAIGQVVVETAIENKKEIALGEMPVQGLYFYSIIDNFEGNSYKGKFDYQ